MASTARACSRWHSNGPRLSDAAEAGIGAPQFSGGVPLEAHGGYLIRIESFAGLDLVALAREALAQEGLAVEGGLLVTVSRRRKLVRLAYEAPFASGRRGAYWHASHPALARSLSRAAGTTVHAYVFDPEEAEEVVSWGGGRRVGGERVVYEDVELPDELMGQGSAAAEAAVERLRARWPLGHLAHVVGLTREELLRLPRAEGVLLPLEQGASDDTALQALLALPRERAGGDLGPAGSAAWAAHPAPGR